MYPIPALMLAAEMPPSDIAMFDSLASHAILLLGNGDVYTQGANNSGEVGIGSAEAFISNWQKVKTNARLVSTGAQCSGIITNDNKFFYTGLESSIGGFSNTKTFTDYTANVTAPGFSLAEVKEFTLGDGATFFLMNNGDLWSQGSNIWGNVGNGSTGATNAVIRPERRATNVKKVQTKSWNSAYLTNDGKLFVCGADSSGLGFPGVVQSFYSFTQLPAGTWDPTDTFIHDIIVSSASNSAGYLSILASTGPTDDLRTHYSNRITDNRTDPTPTDYYVLRKSLTLQKLATMRFPKFEAGNDAGSVRIGDKLFVIGDRTYGKLGIGGGTGPGVIWDWTEVPAPKGHAFADGDLLNHFFMGSGSNSIAQYVIFRTGLYVAGNIGRIRDGSNTYVDILKRVAVPKNA